MTIRWFPLRVGLAPLGCSAQRICDQVTEGSSYGLLAAGIEADLGTADDYQVSYLVSQAVGELCPAMIWQLWNSAAHFHPTAQ